MSYMRSNGYIDITFVDGTIENMSNEEIANIAQQKNANIAFIGIPFTPMTDSALELLQYLRDRHIFTVVGGTMPTLMPEVFYEKANIIIVGDGEKASVKVLQNYENYKEEETSTVVHGEKIDDLDSVPYPAWDLYPIGKYSLTLYNEKERAMPVLINRGCPFRCTFCSNWFLSERKVRHRNVSSILDEIEHYMKDMHIYSFEFIAENMTLDKKFITDFDKEVENRHLKFKWWSGTRANMIDGTIAQEIRNSGAIGMSFGGEGTYINSGQVLAGKISAVVIGKQCNIGYNVLISARTHLSEDISNVIEKDIFIGNNVWIGNNVVIREGIKIGNNCIVGANSVVTHDVEDNTVVGGVPARVIKVLKCHE